LFNIRHNIMHSNQSEWRNKMFEKQVTALTAILKDTDIQSYAGDGFWKIVLVCSASVILTSQAI
ncbi:MAG: hypothetical protein MSH10_04695, partial [Pygmaiobacter massiliensis]|nr:hypothetical protein [Pygmaiobacter massiliensis]